MDHNYITIIKTINDIVQKYGIQKYVIKWHKLDIPNKFDSYTEFMAFLQKYVASYHHHSFIVSKTLYSESSKKYYNDNNIEARPLPKFKYDMNNKIGTIIFYHFYNGFDQTENDKDAIEMFNLVHKKYIKWKKLNINGLIIDVRKHLGGNMWPCINALVDILGDTTLLSFNQVETKFTEKKWTNIINKKIIWSGQFLSSELAFDKKIAVIVSNKTTSSGEFITAIFYGRKNVKIFGDKTDKTAGYASSNKTIQVNDDISFYFTNSLITTIDGTFHIDEYIKVDQKTNTPTNNAKKWILSGY